MNTFETWWGEPENKVIDAMKVIKDYCEKQHICNACPMFDVCTQVGGKKRWVIPNKRGKKEKENALSDIIDIIHKTIYQFFDVCDNEEEVPMSNKDKLLLEVNKAICNNLKEKYNELNM